MRYSVDREGEPGGSRRDFLDAKPLPSQWKCLAVGQNSIANMKDTAHHDARIAGMIFRSVYPHYVQKVESKGRTKEELHEVILWLTGFDEATLQKHLATDSTFEQFFAEASIHPNAHLITGLICGYRIEEIENPLTRKTRYLDKLVDELAKGRKMEKILRQA